MASAVSGIMAQRLVRTLCVECRVLDNGGVEALCALDPGLTDQCGIAKIYRPGGCDTCGETGFSGREAIAEIIVVNNEIRAAILAGADAREIDDLAQGVSGGTMRQDGLKRVVAGRTSIEEVLRAVGTP